MTDYQISLLSSGGHTISSLDKRYADNRGALGLAHRMLDGRGHADLWTSTRRVGQVTEVSGADVKAVGQLWALQPLGRA